MAARPDFRAAGDAEYPVVLDKVPAIIYVADAGDLGRWHFASPQIKKILGYSPEEWCADPEAVAQAPSSGGPRAGALPGGRERRSDVQPGALEYRLRHRDGSIVWIRDDAHLVQNRDGALRWHGVLSDITERKLAEAELEQRAAQQSAVARLGEHALEGASTAELMHEAMTGAAEILAARDGRSAGAACPRRTAW